MMWHIFSAFDFRFPYLGGVKFSHNAVGGRTNYLTPYPGSTVWAPLEAERGEERRAEREI